MGKVTTIPFLVIGVGNDWRGDDAAGLLVARRLAAMQLPGVTVCTVAQPGPELLDLWRRYAYVVLVDAVVTGSPPGTVHVFDVTATPLPATLRVRSSHAFGLAQAVELARALGALPPRLLLYGIEIGSYEQGAAVSSPVLRTVSKPVTIRLSCF